MRWLGLAAAIAGIVLTVAGSLAAPGADGRTPVASRAVAPGKPEALDVAGTGKRPHSIWLAVRGGSPAPVPFHFRALDGAAVLAEGDESAAPGVPRELRAFRAPPSGRFRVEVTVAAGPAEAELKVFDEPAGGSSGLMAAGGVLVFAGAALATLGFARHRLRQARGGASA